MRQPFDEISYFYPRSPCGERLSTIHVPFQNSTISIHALLAESDRKNASPKSQKTAISIHALLAESDPEQLRTVRVSSSISIHALLAESDHTFGPSGPTRNDFYPRSPCGERRFEQISKATRSKFLSTLSLRRATGYGKPYICLILFLSTLSLRRATGRRLLLSTRAGKFLSTLSLRRATRALGMDYLPKWYFYPRSPCGERPGPATIQAP